jgi:hypothetical protein
MFVQAVASLLQSLTTRSEHVVAFLVEVGSQAVVVLAAAAVVEVAVVRVGSPSLCPGEREGECFLLSARARAHFFSIVQSTLCLFDDVAPAIESDPPCR